MLRADIITAYGLNGKASDPDQRDDAVRDVEFLAKARDLAITITPGIGVCDPWPTEHVLVITCYADASRFSDVKRLAEDVRVAFEQEAVSFATVESNFTLLEA